MAPVKALTAATAATAGFCLLLAVVQVRHSLLFARVISRYLHCRPSWCTGVPQKKGMVHYGPIMMECALFYQGEIVLGDSRLKVSGSLGKWTDSSAATLQEGRCGEAWEGDRRK